MIQTPYRPKLNFPKTTTEKIADIIGLLSLLLPIIFIAFNWSSLPPEIPAHFGPAGEVDRWGSKYELFLLPMISICLFFMLHVLEKKPHTHNYPERLNETNVQAFYMASRQILNLTKNLCTILFAYIIYNMVGIALGTFDSLKLVGFISILVGIFVVIIAGIIKMTKIK